MNAGIYVIHNRANDKFYVGSAVSMQARFRGHTNALQRGDHHSSHLQHAWVKYGADMFDFGCLESVDTKDKLIEREQAWIDALKPWDRAKGYNVSPKAGSCLGIRRTEETKAKLSLAKKGGKASDEARASMSAGQKNRPAASAETCAKISAKLRGRKFSDEHRAKISLSAKNRPDGGIGARMRGKPHSDERKAKLRGRVFSDETRSAMSRAAKNRSDETRAKMSLVQMGKKASDETRARLSAAHRGRKVSAESLEKRRGRRHSVETKAKMSLARKMWYADKRVSAQAVV